LTYPPTPPASEEPYAERWPRLDAAIDRLVAAIRTTLAACDPPETVYAYGLPAYAGPNLAECLREPPLTPRRR
jgi:hypothetical protein